MNRKTDIFLVFDSEADANKALAVINGSYDYPSYKYDEKLDAQKLETSAWAIPRQRYPDNKWVFHRAEEKKAIVTAQEYGFIEEQFQPTWFPCIEDIAEWEK